MCGSARLAALVALALAGAPSLVRGADRPIPQVQIESRIVEASSVFAHQIGVYWRGLEGGRSELLVSAPAQVDGQPVDELSLTLDKKLVRGLRPRLLPAGWTFDAAGAVAYFAGPSPVDAARLAIALEATSWARVAIAPRVVLESGNRVVLDLRPEIVSLNPRQLIDDPARTFRLPQRISPGDVFWVAPLDPRFTPAGGTLVVGGLEGECGGSIAQPRYRFEVPLDFGLGARQPLAVTYTDEWRRKLVDGPARDVIVAPRGAPASDDPVVRDCSPEVLAGGSFCLCGNFPDGSASGLTINGRPAGDFLVSGSSSILNFVLPGDTPAGTIELGATRTSSFEIEDGARGVLLRVGAEIDRDRLKRGQSTSLTLAVEGTERPLELRLENSSPGIVRLDGGNDQVVTTSGGRPNRAVRQVHAVSPGDFTINYSLEAGSCPCAGEVEVAPAEPRRKYEVPWPEGEGTAPSDDDPGQYDDPDHPGPDEYNGFPIFLWKVEEGLREWLEQAALLGRDEREAEELLIRIRYALADYERAIRDYAKIAERQRRRMAEDPKRWEEWDWRDVHSYDIAREIVAKLKEYLEDPSLLPWGDEGCAARLEECEKKRRIAEAAEAEARRQRALAEQAWRRPRADAADEQQLETLRRQAAEYRALERSALDRVAKSAERAKEHPGKGYEADIASAEQDAAGYAADAAELEAEARALEAKIEEKWALAGWFRKQAEEAERAAAAAEKRAADAWREYYECLDDANYACPEHRADPGGGEAVPETPQPTTKPEEPKPPTSGSTDAGKGPEPQKEPQPKSPQEPQPKGPGPTPPPGGEIEIERHPLPRLCGPDVTAALEEAMRRIARRVAALPDSELGPLKGAQLIRANWPYHWVQARGEDGAPDPSGEGRWRWDDLIWWTNDAWSDDCESCLECRGTNWLWGRCLSSSFIRDIFEDFVYEMFGAGSWPVVSGFGEGGEAPKPAPPLESTTIAKELAKAFGDQSGAGIPVAPIGEGERAAEAAFRRALAKLQGDTASWWGASCEKCDEFRIGRFREDWSLENWWLSNFTFQHWDGTISTPTIGPHLPY